MNAKNYFFVITNLILLLFARITPAQTIKELFKSQRFWIQNSLSFSSGVMDGTNQGIGFNYASFKKVFPRANDQWFDPQKSWKNKWKNGDRNLGPAFPGSTNFLVWSTDMYHLTRTIQIETSITATGIFHSGKDIFEYGITKKERWKRIRTKTFEAACMGVARSIGFSLTYNVLLKNRTEPITLRKSP